MNGFVIVVLVKGGSFARRLFFRLRPGLSSPARRSSALLLRQRGGDDGHGVVPTKCAAFCGSPLFSDARAN